MWHIVMHCNFKQLSTIYVIIYIGLILIIFMYVMKFLAANQQQILA